jgi:hypothetical protein
MKATTALVIAGLGAVAALCGLGAAYLVGGATGLLTVGLGLAVLAALALRLAVPAAPPAPAARPARQAWPASPAWIPSRVRPGRRIHHDADPRDFPAYRRILSALGWAAVSPRHYDLHVRPLLARLLAATPADRRGDGRARAVVGDDLWPLVDGSRPVSTDSDGPGVDLATVTRIVDRLEHLADPRRPR